MKLSLLKSFSLHNSTIPQELLVITYLVMYFIPLLLIIFIWLPLLFIIRWRHYRIPLLPKVKDEKENDETLPITVVIALEGEVEGLYALLTSIFNQQYAGTIHVLIANYSGEKAVEETLLRMERDFRHLKHTNIATTTHLIDRKKLAMSVGIKGARTEWVMLLDADVLPPAPNWLQMMMEARGQDGDIVVGYSNYDVNNEETTLWHYDVHLQNIQNFKVARIGNYTGGFLTHALIRKSHFLEQQGFSNRHTRLSVGALPLLVSNLSRTGRVCATLSAETGVFKVHSHENDFHQEALEHHIIYYYMSVKSRVINACYNISACFLITLPLLLLYAVLQNVALWMHFCGRETAVKVLTITPNSPMIWEVVVHTIIIVVFLALLIIPLRRLHQSFEGVGINMSYPKLLIYPFLLPIYRTNKRILAFFCRKKCVRRL